MICRLNRNVLWGLMGACALACAVGASGAPQTGDEAAEASVRLMHKALASQRDGSNLSLLFAMRQLHDPGLRPVFERCLASDNWQIQVHGGLGLAELESEKGIDAAMFARLLPRAQEALAATGLDLKLIAPESIPSILNSENLDPMARLILTAELVSLKQPVEPAALHTLAQATERNVAGLASLLLAQLGDPAHFEGFLRTLQETGNGQLERTAGWLMDVVRQYRLSAASAWVLAQAERQDVDAEHAYRCLHTMLAIDPQAGVRLWNKFAHQFTSYTNRVRFGLILLSNHEVVPAGAYDALHFEADEEVIVTIVAVGKAVARKENVVEPLKAMFDLGHPRSVEWAMSHCESLPTQDRIVVYTHLIERLNRELKNQADAVARAIEATTKLAEIDLAGVLAKLSAAEDDSRLQQALFLGLFESNAVIIGDAAAKLPRVGSGRADSLALLLMAKHLNKLEPDDVKQLGVIASGGGRLSELLQIQAAWFYLKHTGKSGLALMQ